MKQPLSYRTALLLLFAVAASGVMAITKSLTYNGSTYSVTKNQSVTVSSHNSDITLSAATDYVITSGESGDAMTATINITNERAAVIFRNIRPTNVVNKWLRYIKINGAQATDGTNCRVEVYRHGAIVLPYGGSGCHPLTVYKGTSLSGEFTSSYDVGTYYNSLGSFDNAISSFTLKRGYMVTMANHSDGTGYSHCFIANDGDITVTLPLDMRGSVSFLRVFEWQWPSKKGYAGLSATPMNLMRVTWFYQWNAEEYQYSDYDYVPQRHHENGTTYSGKATYAWPSWQTINALASPHVLGVNEPDNISGSEMYMPVADLIKLHADYLRSGMRIGTFATCNPNVSWVKDYVDSCEAHNYRVDFVATHYYIGGQTPQACINSLKSLYTATSLPVWCTEWNNGANWTSETQFYTDSLRSWYTWGSGDDQKMNGIWLRDVLKRADANDNTEWLERMAVYNNVEQKRFVNWESDDYWTTSGGAIYGSYNSDFAYKKTTDIWMNWRDQGNPSNLSGGISADGNSFNLIWKEPNTDWIKKVYVQQKSGNSWITRATLGVSDDIQRSASLDIAACSGTKTFRIASVDANGSYHYSQELDLNQNDAPNGYMKITAIPENAGDYYYAIYSKNSATPLCWTLANAAPTSDYTALVGTSQASWQGASGTYSSNGINLVELYNSSAAGVKMQQTVRSLPNGVYQAVLYATSHNARGENGATLNGTRDDVAYVFATSGSQTQKTYFTASGVTPGFLAGEPHECTISNIQVTDGTLTLGLGLDISNITGWHTLQIKSLTRTGNISGVASGTSAFKAVNYSAPTSEANRSQVWQFEKYGSNAYSLRSPEYHDYVLCSPSAALFQTDGKTHLPSTESALVPVYDSSSDCWRMQNASHSTYCGVGGTPAAGNQLAGDKTKANADKLAIYAISKLDFNHKYIVEQGNHDANYTIDNANLSWGSSTGATSGSGRVEYPTRWTFLKTFDGWNDAFTGTATLSDGHNGTFFNAWAGNFTYAELMQEVTSLPNGIYKLTADFATTNGYKRTDSRTALYANAGAGNITRSYNITGTGDNDFNNYCCYALVTGNRMTIGARSDGTWFKVADFRLEYVCQEDEATEEILGYLDNGRALQHQCWLMDSQWVDLTAYPHCRNLQIDQTPPNALVKISPEATIDTSYNPTNIIQDGICQHFKITDEAPLAIEEAFEAKEVSYIRNDATNQWHELFLPFAINSSQAVNTAKISTVEGNDITAVVSPSSVANQPALVKFSDATLNFSNITVQPTAEYNDAKTGLQGFYQAGKAANPLRWCGIDGKPLSSFNLRVVGDVNRDGTVSLADVMAMVGIILGEDSTQPYMYDHDAADMNGDGTISVTDVTELVNYILN